MINRRDFVKAGALGTAAVAVGGCAPGGGNDDRGKAAASGSVFEDRFELQEATIDDLQGRMESGELSAQDIARLYLDRIERVNLEGPELHAIIATNPEALDIAGERDRERAEGKVRGPLHGIPIIVKDNLDTADRMATTAGSLALAGTVASEDATVVRRLREAGAVLLGKANLSEWANFRSERSSSGWSGVGGQTRNPYALDRNPCGSSSGSGVATTANLATIAIGTETDGSVVCPSSANGIVGIKPTLGLVSRAGIVPIAHSQDTAGPMARTVRDAAILLGAICGADPRDAITEKEGRNAAADYTTFLDDAGLRGARIGVWRDRFGFHERVDAVLEEALVALMDGGAELIDPVEMESFGRDLGNAEYEVLLYEFKADLDAYLEGRGEDTRYRTLQALIDFNEANRDAEMPYFQQEIFLKAQEKGPLTDEAYREALETCRRLSRVEGIDRLVAEERLDAIVAPTGGPAWTTDLINGDHFGGGSSQAAAVSGYANVTVPAGFVFGLPVGLSFIGPAFSEPALLRLAYAFERATSVRRPPRFLSTADLTV
ncbi:MAG: amidase [Acidobacteriota bacterium]|jgi:amidase